MKFAPLRHREPPMGQTLEDQLARYFQACKTAGDIWEFMDYRKSKTRMDFRLYISQQAKLREEAELRPYTFVHQGNGQQYTVTEATIDVEGKQKLTQYAVGDWKILQNLNLSPDDVYIPEDDAALEDTFSLVKSWAMGHWNPCLIIQNWVPANDKVYSVVMGVHDLLRQVRLNEQANRPIGGGELKGKVVLDLRIGTRIDGEDISKADLLPVLFQKAMDNCSIKALGTDVEVGQERTSAQKEHDAALQGLT